MGAAARIDGEVVLDHLLDFLLGAQAFRALAGGRGVEAQPDGIAVLEEVADRLLAAERDVLALVVPDDEFLASAPGIEVEAQLGFAERRGQRLAGFELENLVGEVVTGAGVGGGEAQVRQPAADGFAVKHRQQRRLAHAALAEQADALRPAQLPHDRFSRTKISFHRRSSRLPAQGFLLYFAPPNEILTQAHPPARSASDGFEVEPVAGAPGW